MWLTDLVTVSCLICLNLAKSQQPTATVTPTPTSWTVSTGADADADGTEYLIRVLREIEVPANCPVVFTNCDADAELKPGINFEQISRTLGLPSFQLTLSRLPVGSSSNSRPLPLPRVTHFSCTHLRFMTCFPDVTEEGNDELRRIVNHVKALGEPKNDLYLYALLARRTTMTSTSSIAFEYLFQLPAVQRLKFKLGIDLVSELIYEEPDSWSWPVPQSPKNIPTFNRGAINLRGRHLKVSANTLKPFILTEDDDGSAGDTPIITGGTHYMILQHGAEYYNFSLEYDIDPARGSGKKLENGSYNGMMGDVLQRGYDIAFVARLVEGQIGIIDLTAFTSVDTLIFLIAHPKRKLEWEAMMYSFQPSAWLLIFITFVCTAGAYLLCTRLEAAISHQRSKYSIYDAFTISFATGLAQMTRIPKKTYFLTSVWLLYVLNINIAYNSNLISYLNFPSHEMIPRSFEELAQRPDYNITFNYLSSGQCYCYTFFTTSKSPVYSQIADRFASNLEPDTGACVLTAALKPKNVCVGWRSVTNVGLARNATIYHETFVPLADSAPAYVSYNAIGLDKDSKYTDSFSRYITMLRDTGIVNQLYKDAIAQESSMGRKWLNDRQSQNSPETRAVRKSLKAMMNERLVKTAAFKLENFEFHFSVLGAGLVFGCISLLFEFIHLFLSRISRIVQRLRVKRRFH